MHGMDNAAAAHSRYMVEAESTEQLFGKSTLVTQSSSSCRYTCPFSLTD